MKVVMEVFSGDPPCPDCIDAFVLADEYIAQNRPGLEIVKLSGKEAIAKFNEYGLECTPAIVINGIIRIEGICPSKVTLDNALKEAGL